MFPVEMPTIDFLKGLASSPRVHGNGFLQLDIDDDLRMHVWGDPRIPRQDVSTPIHDHVFSFLSRCYRGRIISIPYTLVSSDVGDYDVYACVQAEGHDTKLVKAEGTPVFARPHMPEVALSGDWYPFNKGCFHESLAPELTVTIIDKAGPTVHDEPAMEVRPRVLVPIGTEPDNTFDRHAFDNDLLWRIVEEAVSR